MMRPPKLKKHESVTPSARPQEFSLVLGGPLYRLLLKTRLAHWPVGLLYRRVLVIVLLAWLPMMVLSVIEASAWGRVRVPFLLDVESYARFLVALPLLLFLRAPATRPFT